MHLCRTIPANLRWLGSVTGLLSGAAGENILGETLILLVRKPVRNQARDSNYFCTIGFRSRFVASRKNEGLVRRLVR